MIFLAGSGRATDAVLAARRGEPQADVRLHEIATQGQIFPHPISEPPATLANVIRRALAVGERGEITSKQLGD